MDHDDGLVLTYLMKQEEGVWTGLCLELDIAADGDTTEDVVEVLNDLVGLYLADCIETGDIPIPLRPTPVDALIDFVAPPSGASELPLISHRESVLVHAAA